MEHDSKTTDSIPHIIVIFIILVFTFCVVIATASIAGYIYDMQHAIPNPVERGEDLGGALVVMFYGAISIFPSVVLSILYYKRLLKIILKFIGTEK